MPAYAARKRGNVRGMALIALWALTLGAARAEDGAVSSPQMAAPSSLEPAAQAASPTLPLQELNARWVYQLLLAEIAAQRNHFALATKTYLDLARTTRDPRVARRATEVALYGHDLAAAQTALELWLKEEPKSPSARETLGGLLMAQPHLEGTLPMINTLLNADKDSLGDDMLALDVILSQHPDAAEAWRVGQQIAEPYPDVPEAHYLLATLALRAGNQGKAEEEVQEALKLRPDWGMAVAMDAQLLQKTDPTQALNRYRRYLDAHPQEREMRLQYARLLVEQKDYAEGKRQFEALLQAQPGQPDLLLAVGLLDMQLGDYASAETQFHTVLDHGYRDGDRVRFYLGQAAEEQHQWDNAIRWYSEVSGEGEQRPLAQIRVALIEAQQGKVQQALDRLSRLPVDSPLRLEQRTLAQEQIQRDSGDDQGAWDTLTATLATLPDSADLLYERAMVEDKLGQLNDLEKDLRRVYCVFCQPARARE